MKKSVAILASLLISASAFAATSALLTEYKKRSSARFTKQHRTAFALLRSYKLDTRKILKLEIINEEGEFVMEYPEKGVCYGEPATDRLECYSPIGLATFMEGGDSD
jgi:hypothetical protein